MSDYAIKYQHVERWDTDEVLYLKDCKELIVQPKLDGTNGVVTYVKEYDELVVGSRNRVLSVNNDNQGFAQYIEENREKYLKYFRKHPDDILYGEFLINHVFKVKPEYHNTFYVFDRYDTNRNIIILFMFLIDMILRLISIYLLMLLHLLNAVSDLFQAK